MATPMSVVGPAVGGVGGRERSGGGPAGVTRSGISRGASCGLGGLEGGSVEARREARETLEPELVDERGLGVGLKGGSGAFSLRGTSFEVVGAQMGDVGKAPRESGSRGAPPMRVGRRRRSFRRGGGESAALVLGRESAVEVETRREGEEELEGGEWACLMRSRTDCRFVRGG